jgi:hypothetical protein
MRFNDVPFVAVLEGASSNRRCRRAYERGTDEIFAK